jgi:hypothetical protein
LIRLAGILRRFLFRGRAVAASLFAVVLCVAPLALSAGAHIAHHHSHEAVGHDHGPALDGQTDLDHDVFHCGSPACAPSFLAGCPSDHALHNPSPRLQGVTGDDSLLRPLYLNCDPPVPRAGFPGI